MTQGEQEKLRSILHDLSNVMTGVLMSGGLLRRALRGDAREHHAEDVCDSGERGAALLREARVLIPQLSDRTKESVMNRPVDCLSGESMRSKHKNKRGTR